MKLALGVIVFVDLKAGDVVSHSVQNNVYTSVQHGRYFQQRSMVVFIFFRHADCIANVFDKLAIFDAQAAPIDKKSLNRLTAN